MLAPSAPRIGWGVMSSDSDHKTWFVLSLAYGAVAVGRRAAPIPAGAAETNDARPTAARMVAENLRLGMVLVAALGESRRERVERMRL